GRVAHVGQDIRREQIQLAARLIDAAGLGEQKGEDEAIGAYVGELLHEPAQRSLYLTHTPLHATQVHDLAAEEDEGIRTARALRPRARLLPAAICLLEYPLQAPPLRPPEGDCAQVERLAK